MEEQQDSHNNAFLAGLVLGGVIGAALALVFSKDENDQFRKTLIKKGKTVLKNLGEMVTDEKESLKLHWGDEEDKPGEEKTKKLGRFFHRNGRPLT